MPLFDFTCRACNATFEALVRAGHPAVCPSCGGSDLEQHLASFAVKTAERSQAAAAANRHKYAVEGHKETIAREAEAEKHRHEDH
jgi:putative FmdB family regulatory protein